MGGKNSAPPPPNYAPIAAASEHQAELQNQLGQEQLDWAKQQYNDNKGVTDDVVKQFMTTQETNDANAAADRQRYEDTFQPLEDSLAKDANDYASDSRRDQNIGAAQAGVGQQFDAARDNATQQLESFGINPGSTRYAALDIGTRTQEAAAKASAGTQASLQTDATARALRSEAINVGRGYPGQIAGTYGTANAAGTGAVNSGNSTMATGAAAMGSPGSYFGNANQAIGQWGNTLNQGYQNQMSQFNANQQASSGWGAALGAVAGIGLGVMGMPTSSIGGKMLGFAKGGAVPAGGDSSSSGPFEDDKYYLYPAHDENGRVMGHDEATKRLFDSGHHYGAFENEEHAHAHVQKFALGGTPAAITPQDEGHVSPALSPSSGAATDDIPARLNAGEFIVPKDAAAWLGEEKLQKLILKARQDKNVAAAKPSIQPTAPQRQRALPVG